VLVLNYAHPLTKEQRERIEELAGQKIEQVLEIPVQFDVGQPFLPQVERLIRETERLVGRPKDFWQKAPLLINLPSLNFVAAVLLSYLHGLMGYWPTVIRLRPVEGSTPRRFEVAELINLDEVRQQARQARQG